MTARYLLSYLLEPVSHLLFLCAVLIQLRIGDVKLRHKVLGIYYLLGFSLLVKIVFSKNNSYLYSLLYLLNSVGVGFYFFFLFETSKKRWLALLPAGLTLFYYLIKTFYLSADPLFPSIGFVLSSLGVVVLIFIFLYQLMTHVKEGSLSLSFDFWFICSQLIYHLGAFAIFLTYNNLTSKFLTAQHFSDENRDILRYLWGVHNVLLFLGSLLTLFGILWIAYRRKSSSL